MKIKTKLRLAAICLISMSVAVALLLFFVDRQVDESLRRGEVARQIVKGASELNLMTYDYLLSPGERPLKQWQLKHSSVSKLIATGGFGEDKEKVLIEKRISQNHEAIKALFNQIVTDYEKLGILRGSGTQSVSHHEVSEKLGPQLIAKTQMILNDASLLRNKSDLEIALTKRKASIYVIVSVVLMIIIVALTSTHLSTSIGRSLSKLEEGTQVIAGGDLDHKVDIKSKDETAKLAMAFNEMTGRLKTSYASIDDLKRMEEELRKSRDELEIRVQERTVELARANEELKAEMVKCAHAEEALREQSKILEGFFTSTITPLVFLDRDFNFIRVNKAYAKACQRDVSEFPGHNHFEFYPSDAKAIFEQVVETRKPHQTIARSFTFPDHPEWGTTYWDWTLTPILDDEGEVEHLVFSLEDVTRHKRDDLALRNASIYTRGLIEASLDPLVTIRHDGKVMDVNKATELVSGKSREEMIGSDFSDYFTDPERARKGYEEVFQKGFVRDYPLTLRHTSGRVIEVLYHATVYKNEAGEVQGVFAAARDITERKRAEESLRESEKRLRLLSSQLLVAQEQERKLIAGEIHDSLGASLAATKFKLEEVITKVGENRPQTRATLESILPMLQETIRETRRIQLALRPPMLDDLGILATITWFCRQFETTYSNIHIRQEISIEESEVPGLLKTVIYRVLQEAMNNIAKHSKADRINLLLRKMDGGIELGIQDNGEGFDPEQALARIGTTKGLGLDSMRERTELSGGSFSIESCRGSGTVIRAKWPIEGLFS